MTAKDKDTSLVGNDGYLAELVKQIVEAGREIGRHNKEVLDKGGVLDRLNDAIAALNKAVDVNNANASLLRSQLAGQGTRLSAMENAIAGLRQLLTDALLRLGSLENSEVDGIDNQVVDGPIRVLVVDDIVELRRTIERILTSSAMHVLVAGSLEEAREILATDPIVEVVLVDLKLPDGSGLELLQYKSSSVDRVEFVVMSAMGDQDMAEEAIRRGAYRFLEKPFKSNGSLVVAVQQAAEHRRLLVFKRKFSHAQTTATASKDHK